MSLQPTSDNVPASPNKTKRFLRLVAAVLALTIVAGSVWGRSLATGVAIRQSQANLASGAIGPAEAWLNWAAGWFGPDYRLDLAHARCGRQLGEHEAWQQAINAAKQQDAPPYLVRAESRLAAIRWGQQPRISEADFADLIEQGVSSEGALSCVVQGLIAVGEPAQARRALAWPNVEMAAAELSYLSGLCHWADEDLRQAQADFEQTLKLQPRHELARASLGRLYEQQEQIGQALPHYARLALTAPHRESLQLDLARVLRKLGRTEESRMILPEPAIELATMPVALEMAERCYASGNYREALQWFERADLQSAHLAETLRTAASAMALAGRFVDSQQLFTRVDEAQANSRHASELRRRLEIDPNDPTAAIDLEQLTLAPRQPAIPQPSQLYATQCAACHGADGNADGRAARFLFPRPRNLRTHSFRLVSTVNTLPSRGDIERVIRQGIPGTAMRAFPDLSDQEFAELVDVVEGFRRAGVREQIEKAGQYADMQLESAAVDELVAARTTPAELLTSTFLDVGTPLSVERGRAVYEVSGCGLCHGSDGRTPQSLSLVDDSGRTVVPRDLARDPMKGGADGASLYRRIRLGMPGSPHPGLVSVSEQQLMDLVYFCQSLSVDPKIVRTNQQREIQAASPK